MSGRHDETERVEGESGFRALVEGIPGAVYRRTTAEPWAFEYVSDGVESITGHRAGELLGPGIAVDAFAPVPDDLAAVSDAMRLATSSGQPYDLEYRITHADGTTRWVHDRGKPERDLTGAEATISGVLVEVTERKQAEQALEQQQARLLALMANIPDHIYFKDADSRFTMIGAVMARRFGLRDPSEAVGKTDFDFFPEENAQPSLEDEQAVMRTGTPVVDREEQETWPDGRKAWASTTKLPYRDATGRVIGTFGISRDITERKRVAATLTETNERLVAAVAQATRMTLEADRANATKSDFLANMSHEIRTPMNGVIGMIGLLLDTELDDEQRHYAETVRSSSESLLELLNDILDFSKIEAGSVELERVDFDLRALLDDFASMPAVRAQEQGIEFICAVAPDVPAHLIGDPGRLRQVLINLAGNALKFTHEGEVSVRATLISETDTDAVVSFSVRDTGIGIAAEHQARLFEKFTQADASTTRRYGGTGLGLAISKRLVELMGGEIGLVSEVGRGSEFWFRVRFAKQAERDQHPVPTAEIRGVHILVVDDNATNREVLIAQLKSWGARVSEVKDGPSALAALGSARDAGDPFEAAILDMQMPDMDGADLARAIKADDTLDRTHLVLMTSLGQRGDARHMEELGFAAYLVKPTRQSDLFDTLSAVLARSPQGASQRIVTRHAVHEMRRSGTRILLAEDNLTNQQVAVGILRKIGLGADVATNGAEALRALSAIRYDLVLMDIQMPEMDGLEATRRIRDPGSAVLNHGVPIIAMTAHARKDDRERCLAAGMDDYVTKPILAEALATAVDRWLPRDPPDTVPLDQRRGLSRTTSPDAIAATGTVVFDQTGMLSRLMGDEDLARTVVDGFLGDVPGLIEALRGDLGHGDLAGALRHAHTIRGASAAVGGETLRAVSAAMEAAATAGDIASVASRLPDLEAAFARLGEAMTAFRGEVGAEAGAQP